MTFRITVVLEYPSILATPRIIARTRAIDLGDGAVTAVQFSDALRELEVLDRHADEDVRRRAQLASESYSGAPTYTGSRP